MTSTTTFPDWVKTSSCTCTPSTKKTRFFEWSVDSDYTSQVYGDKTIRLNDKTQVMCTGPGEGDPQDASHTHIHYTVPSDAILTRVKESQPWKLEYDPTFESGRSGKPTQQPEFKSGYQKLQRDTTSAAREALEVDPSDWELVIDMMTFRASEQQ